jgi:nucleoside-diphosphate-sugar epimerase
MAKTPITKILVTGSVGQIGSELTMALRERYGAEQVVATGRKTKPSRELEESGPFEFIDVAVRETVDGVCDKYGVNAVVHMAAILSAVGEQNPMRCWDVNMNGTLNVLEVAREREMAQVLIPSSIAAFGPETPRDNTPQETVLKPRTMYGVTKVAGELVSDYYFYKYGLDVRGLRYPGIISAETPPGGGTTDYAVAIYYAAVKGEPYKCFVREDTVLPMMYMPDCLKATMDLMEADVAKLKHHSDFNVGAMSFSAGELAASIKKYVPGFEVTYEPDFRQAIADSWPRSLDDSAAREEWGWAPAYDLDAMTQDMLERLKKKYEAGTLPEM